jgi:CRP/FNR family transcriptional regulator
MADQKSSVLAMVEEQTELLMIPIAFLEQWMMQFPSWKAFIMQTYAMRFNELLKAFDAVAFLRMDERLIQYLAGRRKAEGTDVLQLSHQDIAHELHTSREVISRLLKRLEHDGQLKLGRNRIELNPTATWLPNG